MVSQKLGNLSLGMTACLPMLIKSNRLVSSRGFSHFLINQGSWLKHERVDQQRNKYCTGYIPEEGRFDPTGVQIAAATQPSPATPQS